MQDFQINREKHPTLSVYWISESVERGRPVYLSEVNCIFCKRTLISEFKGEITKIENAPVDIALFGMSLTARCKFCKQNYRFVVVESYLG